MSGAATKIMPDMYIGDLQHVMDMIAEFMGVEPKRIEDVCDPTFIEQAKKEDRITELAPVLNSLRKKIKPIVTQIRFMTPFSPWNLKEYLNSGTTPTKGRMMYQKGKLSGVLQMTRKRDLGQIAKFAIPFGAIVIFLILYTQGVFDPLLKGNQQALTWKLHYLTT